ncbi:MAG: hypothetical protein HY894_02600 [Deltaproteobacteria bacterium]|nr:hypothetical protein [Deltaproteobacteria bacterium]
MHSIIRPVRIGLFLGLATLLFGIFWAMYLAVNHERIHKSLSERGRSAVEDKFVLSADGAGHGHAAMNGQTAGHDHHDHAAMTDEDGGAAHDEMHADPAMREVHERLTRGHIHAMGLGLIAMAVSLTLAFLTAPLRVKTFASACAGVGGLFYPFAWIIMGYRTAALGAEAAENSVLPIVVFSVALVLVGILVSLAYLVRGALRGE